MIVLMAGLPGTGKTALAQELALRTGGRVLSKDEFRHALFSKDEIEYSTRQDDFCMGVMLKVAGELIERNPGRNIFLDGRTFSRRYQIENAIHAADAWRQSWRILECVCADDIVQGRLQDQSALGAHPAGNRNFELYLRVKARFETIMFSKTVIDTAQPLHSYVEQALSALR